MYNPYLGTYFCTEIIKRQEYFKSRVSVVANDQPIMNFGGFKETLGWLVVRLKHGQKLVTVAV